MNSKEYFFDQVINEVLKKNPNLDTIRILELGCGAAPYVKTLVEKYSNLEYTGVEPIDASYKKAVNNLQDVPRTKIILQLGYDVVNELEDESFDVVLSFSVLEHVKQLGKFIQLSARYVKKGGLVVHRYDLGHALYPANVKEKLHVTLGNYLPIILPERTFVRYVPQTEVESYYLNMLGQEPYLFTYHQMPSTKLLEKTLNAQSMHTDMIETLYDWEFKNAEKIATIKLPIREMIFPTVAIWGRKSF